MSGTAPFPGFMIHWNLDCHPIVSLWFSYWAKLYQGEVGTEHKVKVDPVDLGNKASIREINPFSVRLRSDIKRYKNFISGLYKPVGPPA